MESHLSQQIPRGVFGRHHGIHAAVVLPRRLQSGRQDASLVVQPRGLQTVDQLEHLRLGVLFRGRKKRVERERRTAVCDQLRCVKTIVLIVGRKGRRLCGLILLSPAAAPEPRAKFANSLNAGHVVEISSTRPGNTYEGKGSPGTSSFNVNGAGRRSTAIPWARSAAFAGGRKERGMWRQSPTATGTPLCSSGGASGGAASAVSPARPPF